jgi:hypothetical protein
VFAGVGERTREGNDLYREMIESGGCTAWLASLLRQHVPQLFPFSSACGVQNMAVCIP